MTPKFLQEPSFPGPRRSDHCRRHRPCFTRSLYIYPLPPNSAVNNLSFIGGGKVLICGNGRLKNWSFFGFGGKLLVIWPYEGIQYIGCSLKRFPPGYFLFFWTMLTREMEYYVSYLARNTKRSFTWKQLANGSRERLGERRRGDGQALTEKPLQDLFLWYFIVSIER